MASGMPSKHPPNWKHHSKRLLTNASAQQSRLRDLDHATFPQALRDTFGLRSVSSRPLARERK
jgi:hypothetical protein